MREKPKLEGGQNRLIFDSLNYLCGYVYVLYSIIISVIEKLCRPP